MPATNTQPRDIPATGEEDLPATTQPNDLPAAGEEDLPATTQPRVFPATAATAATAQPTACPGGYRAGYHTGYHDAYHDATFLHRLAQSINLARHRLAGALYTMGAALLTAAEAIDADPAEAHHDAAGAHAGAHAEAHAEPAQAHAEAAGAHARAVEAHAEATEARDDIAKPEPAPDPPEHMMRPQLAEALHLQPAVTLEQAALVKQASTTATTSRHAGATATTATSSGAAATANPGSPRETGLESAPTLKPPQEPTPEPAPDPPEHAPEPPKPGSERSRLSVTELMSVLRNPRVVALLQVHHLDVRLQEAPPGTTLEPPPPHETGLESAPTLKPLPATTPPPAATPPPFAISVTEFRARYPIAAAQLQEHRLDVRAQDPPEHMAMLPEPTLGPTPRRLMPGLVEALHLQLAEILGPQLAHAHASALRLRLEADALRRQPASERTAAGATAATTPSAVDTDPGTVTARAVPQADVALQANGYTGVKAEMLGAFELQAVIVQGRPTYKKRGAEVFLYYSTSGAWRVGPDTSKDASWWKVTSDATTPGAITEVWQAFDVWGNLIGSAWGNAWVDVQAAKIVKRAAFEAPAAKIVDRAAFEAAAAQAAPTTANPAHRSTNTPMWTSSIVRKLASLLHIIAKAIDTDYCALAAAAAKAATTVNTAATDCPTPPREAGLESSPLQAPMQHDRILQAAEHGVRRGQLHERHRAQPNNHEEPIAYSIARIMPIAYNIARIIALLGVFLLAASNGIARIIALLGEASPSATTCQAASPSATTLQLAETLELEVVATRRTIAELEAQLDALVATRQ
jgi:hypothetical protein